MKTGDAIEKVAGPVAKAIDSVFGTHLQNCGGCRGAVTGLNAGTVHLHQVPGIMMQNLGDAFYDRFAEEARKKRKGEQ
jgi:hypothetical protein